MFSLVCGCYDWATSKEEVRVLVVGPESVGKTTLLEQLKRKHIRNYRGPKIDNLQVTLGMNLGKLPSLEGCDATIWDVGGSMKSLWDRYYSEADAVVFMFDVSADEESLLATRKEFRTYTCIHGSICWRRRRLRNGDATCGLSV